jgi:predicted HicB family RNase H-like nuclease
MQIGDDNNMDTVKRKTTTSTEVKRRYNEKAYDRVSLTIYKGQRDILQAYAKERGISVNTYIQGLIRADMEQDGGDVAAWDALAPDHAED